MSRATDLDSPAPPTFAELGPVAQLARLLDGDPEPGLTYEEAWARFSVQRFDPHAEVELHSTAITVLDPDAADPDALDAWFAQLELAARACAAVDLRKTRSAVPQWVRTLAEGLARWLRESQRRIDGMSWAALGLHVSAAWKLVAVARAEDAPDAPWAWITRRFAQLTDVTPESALRTAAPVVRRRYVDLFCEGRLRALVGPKTREAVRRLVAEDAAWRTDYREALSENLVLQVDALPTERWYEARNVDGVWEGPELARVRLPHLGDDVWVRLVARAGGLRLIRHDGQVEDHPFSELSDRPGGGSFEARSSGGTRFWLVAIAMNLHPADQGTPPSPPVPVVRALSEPAVAPAEQQVMETEIHVRVHPCSITSQAVLVAEQSERLIDPTESRLDLSYAYAGRLLEFFEQNVREFERALTLVEQREREDGDVDPDRDAVEWMLRTVEIRVNIERFVRRERARAENEAPEGEPVVYPAQLTELETYLGRSDQALADFADAVNLVPEATYEDILAAVPEAPEAWWSARARWAEVEQAHERALDAWRAWRQRESQAGGA